MHGLVTLHRPNQAEIIGAPSDAEAPSAWTPYGWVLDENWPLSVTVINATTGWQRLMDQLEEGLRFPACGIMIHHQRMNIRAFHFLDTLLDTLDRQKRLKIVDIRELSP